MKISTLLRTNVQFGAKQWQKAQIGLWVSLFLEPQTLQT